jgi:hypothetical protein
MGWGQRWPERIPRPKARSLTEAERADTLRTLEKGIARSPVLSAFGIQARVQRGRFYIERQRQDEDSEPYTEVIGRITPLARAKKELLLESQRRNGSWFEVTRGSAGKLIKLIASDTKGTFHGLGSLEKSLRKLSGGQERLSVTRQGKDTFVYTDTGEGCSQQEALFHYFGLPIEVVAEPSGWYSYHRRPWIVEASKDRTRVLVWFGAASLSGESFGGTCLYVQRNGQWGAYTIKPSESRTIAQAEAWLVKRKWRAW